MRSYDPILGRFHSPDPYLQFNSPYLANFNNPANFVDPSGGWGECFWEAAVAFFKNTNGSVGSNGLATAAAAVQVGVTAVMAVRNISGMHKDLANSVDQFVGEIAMATTGSALPNNSLGPELRQTYVSYYYGYNPDGTMYFMELKEIWEEIPVSEMNGPMADEPVKVEAAYTYLDDLPVGQTAQLCPGCESKITQSAEAKDTDLDLALVGIGELIEEYPRIEPLEDLSITEWAQGKYIDDRIEGGIVYDAKGYPIQRAPIMMQAPDFRGGFNKAGKGLKKLVKWFKKGRNAIKTGKALTKKSIIQGYKVSNHAWRKSGLGRGATEEMVDDVIVGARKAGTIAIETGTGQFAGNIIKVYTYNGIKVVVDETQKIIMSIRPIKGFKLP